MLFVDLDKTLIKSDFLIGNELNISFPKGEISTSDFNYIQKFNLKNKFFLFKLIINFEEWLQNLFNFVFIMKKIDLKYVRKTIEYLCSRKNKNIYNYKFS